MPLSQRKKSIRLAIWIDASPKKVFHAITRAEYINRWFQRGARSDPRPGGSLKLGWTPNHTWNSRFESFIEDKAASFKWCKETRCGGGGRVTFSLRRVKRGTTVNLLHNGFNFTADLSDVFANHMQGWAAFLCNLKALVEKNGDLRADQPPGSLLFD